MAGDAVLFGSVGGPKWETLPFELQPERGLLRLRKEMDLFANLRPAVVFEALADASSLKRELVAGLDLMIVRELTGGIYFGEPRGIETLPDGSRRGINTEVYTEAEIERVVRAGFELAQKAPAAASARSTRPTSWNRAILWREVARRVHADYPDVELSFMYADNCAMQLVRNPKQFDVIVTSNLFGDMLSDCAAMLTGSLGMLPSASLGARRRDRPPPRAVRAGAWQRPRHRRQGRRQPARLHSVLRDDAALFVRPAGGGRPRREGGAPTRSAPACAPPTSCSRTRRAISTRDMGDTILRELERAAWPAPMFGRGALLQNRGVEERRHWSGRSRRIRHAGMIARHSAFVDPMA